METLSHSIKISHDQNLFHKEWLLTNGTGGYASTALTGGLTRKYHGLLIASFPPPLGRIIMLNFLQDSVILPDNSEVFFSTQEQKNSTAKNEFMLIDFSLINGIPQWTYVYDKYVLEKNICFIYQQNTLKISYKLLQGPSSLEIRFRPYFNLKHYEAPVDLPFIDLSWESFDKGCCISSNLYPSLKLMGKTPWNGEEKHLDNLIYRIEEERGYDFIGNLKSIGYFSDILSLGVDNVVSYVVSTEEFDKFSSFTPDEIVFAENERKKNLIKLATDKNPLLKENAAFCELVLAADQFIITPPRPADVAKLQALGEEARTIIAGYHWFNDWGRDTMISLEGLNLVTGRFQEAKEILRVFAHHIKNGLIPNMFPDGNSEGLYNTSDATLWFLHALKRYLDYTHDDSFLEALFPKIKEIIQAHLNGTLFGIHMDPEDGLLIQGQQGYALTWMDAKVGDLVVTPRRGKAVEINALWYNGLRIVIDWMKKFFLYQEAQELQEISDKCKQNFNTKFWNPKTEYLYDIVEGISGNDPACRPNQLFSISLDYPVLNQEYWQTVLPHIQNKLLTPYGLRTLASEHPDYKMSYNGSLFDRDLAYHQGTIWTWLLGSYIDAWIRIFPEKINEINFLLQDCLKHLDESCIGNVNEIFDSSPPHIHRGCIAQAWSVAELLRCLAKIAKSEEK
ncbi:MAG: glycogen debranching enzyme family protein [Parachlamydiaceae bacterium]|nr:glycogen debranching enzyme family protein [Parachlamydiaceae bacterium]